MAKAKPHGEIDLLLRVLDEAYDKKAWHGPNLRGTIHRVDVSGAAWRPRPDRHNIAEIVAHAAYWKYSVRRRLRGDQRGSFPLRGSNWFPIVELDGAKWKELVALLDAEHRSLRAAVAEFPPDKLRRVPAGSTVSFCSLIYGVAHHDVYHAGQIQLLKRLQQAS